MVTVENPARTLGIDKVTIGRSTVTLVSCDHKPFKRPVVDPWEQIEEEVKSSSLIFVEYFPPELEETAYKGLAGSIVKDYSQKDGIEDLFNQVGSLAAKYRKAVAVADIANKQLFTMYYFGDIFIPFLFAGLTVFGPDQIKPYQSLGAAFSFLALFNAFAEHYLCESETPHLMERFLWGVVDARRVLTTEALIRASQELPDSNILYIAPYAHTERIKNHLKNPDDVSFRVKKRVYSLFSFLGGLDKETRTYRYDPESATWQKNIRTPGYFW